MDRVAACIERHLPHGGRLSVGYSGGLDSTVLLNLLAGLRGRLGYALSAVHIHHGLSANADVWTAHCERVCAELHVPLRVIHVDVAPAGEGPEAAARAARYREFARLDVDGLALAQHRDDQAETVLLQLLRGGGPKGLSAMPEARRLESGRVQLIRPLLEISRAELAAWARARNLAWVEDESNLQTHFSRNALRLAVLPLIERHFPDSAAVLARSAGQFAETAGLLDALADLDGGEAGPLESLEIRRLAALPEARARNLLRRHLELAGATLRQDGLREGLRQILSARPEAQVELVFGAVALRRYRGRAWVIPATEVVSGVRQNKPEQEIPWQGEAALAWAGSQLRFQAMEDGGIRLRDDAVVIRSRLGGEHLRLDKKRPRRALKDLLRESAIPPWQRERLPLVYVGDRLAWVAGIGADADFVAGPGEQGWRITWTPG